MYKGVKRSIIYKCLKEGGDKIIVILVRRIYILVIREGGYVIIWKLF